MSDQPWKRRSFFDFRLVNTERRRSYRLGLILFGSVVLYYIIARFVISLGVIQDRSMLPTLVEGQYYLVNKYIYRLTRPQRGEVVVLRRSIYDTDQYVKRVVGLPGETLLIRQGDVYINGQRLAEPYAGWPTQPNLGPLVIPGDAYFVLGDNRLLSEDSRSFGAVPLRTIEGKIKPGVLFPVR